MNSSDKGEYLFKFLSYLVLAVELLCEILRKSLNPLEELFPIFQGYFI